jgi:hypothetical protein
MGNGDQRDKTAARADRDRRLAEALRANLKRRKAAARASLAAGRPPADAAGDAATDETAVPGPDSEGEKSP